MPSVEKDHYVCEYCGLPCNPEKGKSPYTIYHNSCSKNKNSKGVCGPHKFVKTN